MKKFEQLKRLYDTICRVYSSADVDSEMYIAGITSDFDRLFELCWKTIKEYMQEEGFHAAKSGSPKAIIKLAYQQEIVDEEIWLDMLDDRNDDAHLYNESAARSYAARISREYLSEVKNLIDHFVPLIQEEPDAIVKVPDSFLLAKKNSGLDYDKFLEKVKKENGFSGDHEVFLRWDEIKGRYLP